MPIAASLRAIPEVLTQKSFISIFIEDVVVGVVLNGLIDYAMMNTKEPTDSMGGGNPVFDINIFFEVLIVVLLQTMVIRGAKETKVKNLIIEGKIAPTQRSMLAKVSQPLRNAVGYERDSSFAAYIGVSMLFASSAAIGLLFVGVCPILTLLGLGSPTHLDATSTNATVQDIPMFIPSNTICETSSIPVYILVKIMWKTLTYNVILVIWFLMATNDSQSFIVKARHEALTAVKPKQD
jgi:hypothetical protein